MRRRPTWRKRLWRRLKPILLFDLALFTVMGLICLLRGRWTPFEYGVVLLLAGGMLMGFGVISLFGGWGQTRSFGYQYGLSAGGDDIRARAQQEIGDINAASAFMLRLFALGVLPGVCGILLMLIFR